MKASAAHSLAPLNCAIIEVTGVGNSVGRCWNFVGQDDQCPRHGDVSKEMVKFRDTGKMTREDEREC